MICCQAKTINFDVNFVNYEDPEVLERFVGPEYEKYWKKTYGYDYVTKLPGEAVQEGDVKSFNIDNFPMAFHCLESEFRLVMAIAIS